MQIPTVRLDHAKSSFRKSLMHGAWSVDPMAHYDTTAVEIVDAIASESERPTTGRVDLLVAGAGTGGTISGIAKRLKEHDSRTRVLGVDPIGSILARPESLNVLPKGSNGMYAVEGIGYDFVKKPLFLVFLTRRS
jgi:cystathionine beta-synthase